MEVVGRLDLGRPVALHGTARHAVLRQKPVVGVGPAGRFGERDDELGFRHHKMQKLGHGHHLRVDAVVALRRPPERVGPAVEHGQRLAGLDPSGHVPVAPTEFVQPRVRVDVTLARRAELASRKKSRFLPPRGRRGWMGSDEPPQIRRAGLRRT